MSVTFDSEMLHGDTKLDLKELQTEVAEWANQNFSVADPWELISEVACGAVVRTLRFGADLLNAMNATKNVRLTTAGGNTLSTSWLSP